LKSKFSPRRGAETCDPSSAPAHQKRPVQPVKKAAARAAS
jgi:hypothetical protein